MKQKITFFGARKPIQSLSRPLLRKTISRIIGDHGLQLNRLVYVLVNDESLYRMNKAYLNHDTYTDIITFDLSESKGLIDGEIYISFERVLENANRLLQREDEFLRVIFHGVLHLCGYPDKTPAQKTLMRKKEDHYITLYRETQRTTEVFHVKRS